MAAGFDILLDPWADAVVSYTPGTGADPALADPATTLGEPERFTGESSYPSAVTIFNPAYGEDELVSIGDGGSLVVKFDEPITNDPAHLYGADLIVFGNGGFLDEQFPDGQIGSPAGAFGFDQMDVWVSADNVSWQPLGQFTEGLFPAQGYRDVPAQSETPGSVLTNFQQPLNPSWSLSTFNGMTYSSVLSLYDGSGGGTPIDISASGLSSVQYVRIENNSGGTVEIEAFAAVPEPASISMGVLIASVALRRKH